MHVIEVREHGGPGVLQPAERPAPLAGDGCLAVAIAAVGVNFIDTYHRTGLYPMATPFVPGLEGAGTVAAVGPGVEGFAVGDEVAWTGVIGSYAEEIVLPADQAVPVPPGIDLDIAAAVMLQGLTAHYLVNDTFPLEPGQTCLIHAGAGGVGALLIQMAKAAGAVVFATVGTAEKAAVAEAAGADHVVDYGERDFQEAIEAIAGPKPIDVVYDGVGAATFDRGLALLRRRGMMVAFGNASGPVPPVDPLRLSVGGSLFLTRPRSFDHLAVPGELRLRSDDVFRQISEGVLNVRIGSRFPLAEAAAAHTALEGRATVGKVLLLP